MLLSLFVSVIRLFAVLPLAPLSLNRSFGRLYASPPLGLREQPRPKRATGRFESLCGSRKVRGSTKIIIQYSACNVVVVSSLQSIMNDQIASECLV